MKNSSKMNKKVGHLKLSTHLSRIHLPTLSEATISKNLRRLRATPPYPQLDYRAPGWVQELDQLSSWVFHMISTGCQKNGIFWDLKLKEIILMADEKKFAAKRRDFFYTLH